MDFSQIITFKMMNKILDGDGELDLSKLFILQSLQKNGTIKIDDIMKAKLIAKFGLDKDEKELSVEKLMLLGMLQNDENFDMSQLMMAKMLDKDEKEFSIEKLMLLGMFQNGESLDISKLVMMKMLDKIL